MANAGYKTDGPLVSILMTAYNRQDYISEAIESVLQSGVDSFELIIVDDGSKDDTVSIAKSYAQKDARVKVYENEKNLGDYANRNRAASYATGVYLKYLDSDDYFLPGGMKYCVDAMEENPDAAWAICVKDPTLENKLLTGKESIPIHLFQQPILYIGPSGMIIKRKYFFDINLFPEIYGPANDMYFNLKAAAANGPLLMLKDDFLFYRIHDGQEFNNKFSYMYNNYNYMRDALQQLPLPLTEKQKSFLSKKLKRRFVVNITKFFFQTRDVSKTRKAIKLANFHFCDALQGIFHF